MSGTAFLVTSAWIAAASMLPSTAMAKPNPAQKCAAAKQQAAGKSGACQLNCTAKAALGGLPTNDPVLVGCVDKCRTKFGSAFAKIEAKGGCDPAGNTVPVEGKVDACARDIADDLRPGAGGPTCTVPFRADARDILDGFAFGLDSAGNVNVPALCSGSTPLCCPGGNPASSCGPLQLDFVPRAGEAGMAITVAAGDPDRVDADIPLRLKTITDIPVSVPLVGDCGLHIDTTAGPPARVNVLVAVQFSADRLRMGPVGAITLNGLTSDDVSLTGGVGCQSANLGLGLVTGTLTGILQDEVFTRFDNLCRRCCSADLAQCAS